VSWEVCDDVDQEVLPLLFNLVLMVKFIVPYKQKHHTSKVVLIFQIYFSFFLTCYFSFLLLQMATTAIIDKGC
jgi:hypothetical protein